jgi:predicted dehydrogenase
MDVAVLGLGSIGLRHARNLLARGHSVFAFDPDAARHQAVVALGGRCVPTRADAIHAANAVVVATPSDCHHDDLRVAVSASRHVLVEKPLAHRRDGIAEILHEAAQKQITVVCGFNLRFHPAVIAAKSALDSGAIGRPLRASFECATYLPDWRPGSDYRRGYAAHPATGGVVFDMIHEIDLALYLLGAGRVDSASVGRSGALEIASEDIANFVLWHDMGARSAIHLDYVTRPPVRRTRIVGTAGRIEIDLLERRFVRVEIDGRVGNNVSFPGAFADDYAAEMDAFLARTEGKTAAGATGEEGLRALSVALDIRRRAGLPEA